MRQDAPGNVSKRLRKEAMGAKKLSEKGEELLAVEPMTWWGRSLRMRDYTKTI